MYCAPESAELWGGARGWLEVVMWPGDAGARGVLVAPSSRERGPHESHATERRGRLWAGKCGEKQKEGQVSQTAMPDWCPVCPAVGRAWHCACVPGSPKAVPAANTCCRLVVCGRHSRPRKDLAGWQPINMQKYLLLGCSPGSSAMVRCLCPLHKPQPLPSPTSLFEETSR
jgi:hypothetical protein